MTSIPQDDPLFTVEQSAHYLGISVRTLYREWRKGRGPKRTKISQGRVVSRKSWLDKYVERGIASASSVRASRAGGRRK